MKSLNSPLPTDLSGECRKAAKILNSFIDPGQGVDKVIPPNIIANAKGLAIFTVIKAGFLFSGRAGSGIVVARLPDGSWSAPSAIGTGGMGFGGQIGAELTDFVVILNNKEAVKTFSHGGSVTLGGNLSGELPSLRLIGEVMSVFVTGAVKDRKLGLTCGHIISSNVSPVPTCPLTTLCFPHAVAAGPVGRNAEAGGSATFKHVAAIYSYSKTKGLFAGVSIEGSVIVERNDANAKFYGQEVTAKDLLNGSVPQPPQADMLYRALNAKLGRLGSTANMYTPGEDQPDGQGGGKPFPPPSYPASQRASYQQPPVQIPVEAEPLKRNIVHGRPVPPPPPMKPRKDPTATALYDFTGEQDGDLTFRKGDIIVVTKKSESTNDWWTGRANGREGSFPANYVQLNN